MIKHQILLSLLFLLLAGGLTAQQEDFRKTAPKPGPAPEIALRPYEQFQLKNGLQVIVVEDHRLPMLSLRLVLDVPVYTEGGRAGTAELAGQMLGRGTAQRSKAELDEAIDFIGASFSTSGSGISASGLTKHQDTLLSIFQEVLYQPAFDSTEFQKVRDQRLSSLALQKDNPDFIARQLAQILRYDGHPYGEVVTEESLNNISVADCEQYYRTYFKPNIAYLVMVGDIDLAEAKRIAQRYFARWEGGEVPQADHIRPLPPASPAVALVHKEEAVQSVIQITYPVRLEPGTRESVVATLLNTILGGGSLNSRLNKNIREDKGYSYGVRSVLSYDTEVGYFSAGGSVRNAVTDSALVELLYELRRLRTEPVPEAELESAKQYVFGYFAQSMEGPAATANFALNTVRYGLDKDYYADYLQTVATVTPADIRRAAIKYLLPDQAHLVVVGDSAALTSKLSAFGKVTQYTADGQLAEANIALPDSITAQMVLEDYLAAIGGRDRLAELQDLSIVASGKLGASEIQITTASKRGPKRKVNVSIGGVTTSNTIFAGERGKVIGIGSREQPVDEAGLARMKYEALMFPEVEMLNGQYSIELKGATMIAGRPAYHLQVGISSETTVQLYYDQVSGLRVRQVYPTDGRMVTSDFSDYREVEGILFPFSIRAIGVVPQPITMQVSSITVNTGLADSLFEIE